MLPGEYFKSPDSLTFLLMDEYILKEVDGAMVYEFNKDRLLIGHGDKSAIIAAMRFSGAIRAYAAITAFSIIPGKSVRYFGGVAIWTSVVASSNGIPCIFAPFYF